MKRLGLFLMTLVLLVSTQSIFATVNEDSLKNVMKDEILQDDEAARARQKDSVILSKLSPQELMELKQQEFAIEKQRIDKEGRNEMPLNGAGIVLLCMLPFALVITIIGINVRARNRESQRRYDIYMKSLEMGQTIPEHFFDEPKKQESTASNLKKGILWLVVGLGIVISFIVIHQHNGLILGIIPAFVGVGFLLVHFLEKPKADTGNNEQHG